MARHARSPDDPVFPDWPQKLAIAMDLLDTPRPQDFVQRVVGTRQSTGDDKASLVLAAMRKWGAATNPTRPSATHHDFFRALIEELHIPESVTPMQFIDAPVDVFIQWLPQNRREQAEAVLAGYERRAARQGRGTPRGTAAVAAPAARYNVHHRMPLGHRWYDSPAQGVRAGRLDMRHYYLEPTAAEEWDRLVQAAAYPQYDVCRYGLRGLVRDAEWQAEVREIQPTTIVMLAGGGSATKDLALLQGVLALPEYADRRISIWILDVSYYMLANSMAAHHDAKNTAPFDRADVEYFVCDVLHLEYCLELLDASGPRLFAITAGTIGNLREGLFFQSLNRVARPNDLLIVSADTIDDASASSRDTMRAALRAKYDNPEMRRFIAPGVAAVQTVLGRRDLFTHLERRIKVEIDERAHATGLSDVPETWSVTMSLDTDGAAVVLVSSTRYRRDAFKAFAAKHGWRSICQVPSGLNQHFVQFCFRKEAERSGTE